MKTENNKSAASDSGNDTTSERKVLLTNNIFKATGIIIALIDQNLNILFQNSAAAQITGWAQEDFQKIAPADVIHPLDKDITRSVMAEAIETPGKTISITIRIRHKGGHYLWMEGTVTNMLHEPEVMGILINMRNITDKIETEEKLQKIRRLYNFISNVNKMIIRTTDDTTLYKEACKIAVEIGKFRMAWIGILDESNQKIIPVMHAGEEKGYLSRIEIITRANTPAGQGPTGTALREGRYVFCNDIENDPAMLYWRASALERGYQSLISFPVKKFGKVMGAFSFYADTKFFFNKEEISLLEGVTGDIAFALENFEKEKLRKKAEETVIESKNRYQALAEISPVGIFHTDATGYTTYVNPRWCQISGLASNEALGNGWLKAVHAGDRDFLKSNWEKVTHRKDTSKSTSEYRFVRPDGSTRWVIGDAVPEKDAADRIVGYVGTITDITEHKVAEEEIAKIYKEKETLLNRINDGMISLDNEWRYTFLNDAALETHPLGLEGTIGKVIWDVHPEMIGTIFWDKYHEAMETRRVVQAEGFYLPMQTWFSVKVYPSHDGLTIFFTDITERVKAQESILKERNLSDSIINSLPGVFYLYNEEGKFLRWNKNFEKVTKYKADEISNMRPLDFFDTVEKEIVAQKIANTFSQGEDYVQADFLIKDNIKIPYYFTGKSIDYEGTRCLVGVGIDFTDRIKAQEKIRETTEQLRMLTAHLQKVREEERKRIGREIHDELGQQLTAIKMDVAWIDKKIAQENTSIKGKLKNVIELLDGSNRSVRRILSELRPGVLDDYNLPDALDWLSKQFTVNTGIPIKFTITETDFKYTAPLVTCIFRVFQEALTNITRYARATQVSGSLTVENDIITVSIEDNGQGFEPEFIQADQSFGILGMKERVLSLGGEFRLISSLTQGTKIMIKLPVDTPDKI